MPGEAPTGMTDDRGEAQPLGSVLSQGRLLDLIRRFPVPAIAWPGRALFEVSLHGWGFVLPIDDGPDAVGFYTKRYVAAPDAAAARSLATERVRERFAVFYSSARGELELEVEHVDRIEGRIRQRSQLGMILYSEAE
jgi:hypothetical protein